MTKELSEPDWRALDAPDAPVPAEPPRTRSTDDRRLLTRYHRGGEIAARDELVERFLPLARQLARRYQRGTEPLDDLVQVASIGLVKAVDRFDPERGTAFSSYAVPTILGELKRYFRDVGWAVHVPRGMQERVMTVNQAINRLSRNLGRSPSAGEIAADIGEDPEFVLEALEAAIAYDAVSLDTPRTSEEAEGDTYADTVGEIDERFELVEYESAIGPTMKALPPRDRLVLKLRFEFDLTQLEIAERIGVSQMHVSRLIRRALSRLRTVADAQ
jgi:RNA polymerase sigma-B factor